ncbi:enoyl-CoA hydratase/isomerase family protein [Dietzia maris]|uniref:enoyl-CoA hydratase/isomerase family protein n=1 Tax=Dietzia maris TaxID=37915 RepID=UPI0037CBFBAB
MSVVETSVADGVGRVILNRPEQMNAITVELGAELQSAIRAVGNSPDVNVLVIRGSGGNFCAGGDFKEVERLRAAGRGELRTLFSNFAAACREISSVPVPVVAVVEGVAMAGGFELMQAADIAIAHDEARIADNHIRFGQIPGGGSTQRLSRLVGRQKALGLLLSGDRLSGIDAHRIGLAYASFSSDDFESRIAEFVSTMAGRDRGALLAIKQLVLDGIRMELDEGLEMELDAVVSHIGAEAGHSGVERFNTRKKA